MKDLPEGPLVKDPYAVPVYGDESDTDPAYDFDELVRLHRRLNGTSMLLGIVGLAMMVGCAFVPEAMILPTLLGGFVLLVWGMVAAAHLRGRSGWWCLLCALGPLGFLALMLVPKRCLACGGAVKAKRCIECDAPGPP